MSIHLLRAIGAAGVAALASMASAQPPERSNPQALLEPDARLLRVAEAIPEFGGMRVDRDGILTVFLRSDTEVTSTPALQQQLRSQLARVFEKGFLADYIGEIRISRADFRLTDLARWRMTMDRTLAMPGVVYTDLDEGRNRVAVGVSSAEVRSRVLAEAATLNIPAAALIVEVVVPDGQHATLRSKHRPLRGGLQIEADVGWFKYKHCTLGFNALQDGSKGFVTNSHCTEHQGGVDGTAMHQPDDPWYTEGNRVGTEVLDPLYKAASFGPCPPGRRCRTSDSAFVKYRKENLFGNALVARTTGQGSITIDDGDPNDTLASVNYFPLQGFVLDKVGRTTGWTSGTVSQTCVHINVHDTDLTLLCSYRVVQDDPADGPLEQPGDSGSPVFRRSRDGDNVELCGILWGGPVDHSGRSFVFSSILFVEIELAPLQVVGFPP